MLLLNAYPDETESTTSMDFACFIGKDGKFQRVPLIVDNLIDTTSTLRYSSFTSSMPNNSRSHEASDVILRLNELSMQNLANHENVFDSTISYLSRMADLLDATEQRLFELRSGKLNNDSHKNNLNPFLSSVEARQSISPPLVGAAEEKPLIEL
ncbi:hypothetical protein HK098_007823 [Nowakowskiella sp. JEL0407]|nr:hypothetical protein HK098_007823 [Nowakowskiella sp. JEL0407]